VGDQQLRRRRRARRRQRRVVDCLTVVWQPIPQPVGLPGVGVLAAGVVLGPWAFICWSPIDRLPDDHKRGRGYPDHDITWGYLASRAAAQAAAEAAPDGYVSSVVNVAARPDPRRRRLEPLTDCQILADRRRAASQAVEADLLDV
jgi:hypothetical protein